MTFRRVLALLVAGVVLSVAGCQPRLPASMVQQPQVAPADEETAPSVMPALVGKTLSQAYAVGGVRYLNVRVSFPSVEATWDVGSTPGVRDRTLRRAKLPEVVKTLTEVKRGGHEIVSQAPNPGAPISADATITLVAGEHPGTKTSPWAGMGHVEAVSTGGAQQCFDKCHGPDDCADCHEKYL